MISAMVASFVIMMHTVLSLMVLTSIGYVAFASTIVLEVIAVGVVCGLLATYGASPKAMA